MSTLICFLETGSRMIMSQTDNVTLILHVLKTGTIIIKSQLSNNLIKKMQRYLSS